MSWCGLFLLSIYTQYNLTKYESWSASGDIYSLSDLYFSSTSKEGNSDPAGPVQKNPLTLGKSRSPFRQILDLPLLVLEIGLLGV